MNKAGGMMAKTTPWTKIKSEYLQGVTPQALSLKYKIKARSISDKAYKENWGAEKAKIYENVRENTEEKIERITNIALKRLEDVLTCEEVKTNDLVTAIGKALDISGLKSQKHEFENKGINIIVADKEHKEMLEDL